MAPAKGGKQATTRRANDEILEEMKNKNKKLLKRLECLTSSIIDRVLNVFKMKQVNHIKKSTKDENIKGEKIFTNEALKQEKRRECKKLEFFPIPGLKASAASATSYREISWFLLRNSIFSFLGALRLQNLLCNGS